MSENEDLTNEMEDDGSLNKFEKMLRSNTNYFFDVDEFEHIIEHYLIHFNYQYAAQAVRIGMRQHPGSLQLKYRKAQLHIINGQPQEALDIIAQLEKHMANHPDLLYLKGSAYTQLNRFDTAILCYNELLTHPVNDPVQLLQKIGESFLVIDQFDIALVYLLKGLEKDPIDQALLSNVAYAYHLKRDFANSKYYYDRYLDEDPFDPVAWIYMAVANNELEEYEKAIEACDFAIALNEKDGSPYYNKANAMVGLGRLEEALKLYQECLYQQGESQEDATYAEIYCCMGECYEQLNDDLNALKNYQHAIRLDENFGDAWYGLSMVTFRQDKYEDCLKFLKKALYLQPSNSDYWFSLGNLFSHVKEIKKAIESYRKAIELNPVDFESWLNLSDLYFKNNMLSKAIKTLNESLPLIGEMAIVHFRLSAYHYLKSEPRLGLKFLKKALEINETEQTEFFRICPDALLFPDVQKQLNQYRKLK